MTPDEAFNAAFSIVWRIENGGDAISVTSKPTDPGGYTRGGVSLLRHPELTRAQLDAMSISAFKIFYRTGYWTPNGCDSLPWPLNLVVFDGEVNEGKEGAVALQKALGVVPDGDIGPVTLAAVEKIDFVTLCAYTMQAREEAYRKNPNFSLYGKGWIRRLFIVAFSASTNYSAVV